MDEAAADYPASGAGESAANGGRAGGPAAVRPRGDTKGRIRAVALELFAEQGYEKTSLREIAERLGVTKAALYYHFRTKDDIVASLFDEFLALVDELVRWADGQVMDASTRAEVIRRY